MSLLTQMMEDCRILNHIRNDDAFGGYTNTWQEGAKFKAAISEDQSPEMKVAEKQGLKKSYTVVIEQGFTLGYHDVFKRTRDGSIFRVTSDSEDSTAHPASTVKIATATAERWELPS